MLMKVTQKVGRNVAAWTDILTYECSTLRRGTVRGAASGTENFHRHLQMNANTSVGILLNCPLQQTALLVEKFQVFKPALFCFLFRQPSFLHLLKFTQLYKLLIILVNNQHDALF